MRVIRRWISSRSIGVMNVLCSVSTQRCVIVSVSCSMSEIRRHFAAMLAPVVTSDRNSLAPSIVSAACCSKKSKKLVSRGRNRPNIAQPPTQARNMCAIKPSQIGPEKAPFSQVVDAHLQHPRVVHDPGVGGIDLGEVGHALQAGL